MKYRFVVWASALMIAFISAVPRLVLAGAVTGVVVITSACGDDACATQKENLTQAQQSYNDRGCAQSIGDSYCDVLLAHRTAAEEAVAKCKKDSEEQEAMMNMLTYAVFGIVISDSK